MKSLKHIIVSLVFAIGLAVPAANAQDDAPPPPPKPKHHPGAPGGPRGGDMTAPLLKDITLTPEQQTKVNEIKAGAQKQMQALSPEERRAKGREIMQQSSDKIRALLTAEQQATFDANKKAMQHRAAEKGGNKGGKDKGGKKDKGASEPKAE